MTDSRADLTVLVETSYSNLDFNILPDRSPLVDQISNFFFFSMLTQSSISQSQIIPGAVRS